MNIRPYLIINGVNTRTIGGLLVTELPPITKGQIRTQIETIDGRDGDIVTPLGFEAYDKPVKIGLYGNFDIDQIIAFFNSSGTVIFSNEPTKVYRFAIYDQIDFERLIRFRTAEVNFHVQPFKFLANEEPAEFVNPSTISITNAGNYYARPDLILTGVGDVTLSINGHELLDIELGETSQTIRISAEEMNAYDQNNELANRLVTGNYDNIKLTTGSNTITLTGTVTSLIITKYSRWL